MWPIAFGQGIGRLEQLNFLDLSGNKIGSTGFTDGIRAIGEGIGRLKQLRFLDFSNNDGLFGVCVNNGSGCNSSVAIILAQEISKLKSLTSLNLADSSLSTTPSILALAYSLNNTRFLQTLNLSGNFIGSMGQEGPTALLSVLLHLPDLDLDQLDLSGMTNVSWTKAADVLQQLHSKDLMTACQNSRCYGGDVQTTSGGSLQSSEAFTPSTARQLMSVDQVYPSSLISGESCVCSTDVHGVETCVCPSDGKNISSQSYTGSALEVDPLTTLGTSAVTGVVFAALPEALGDALYLSGKVSASNAYRIKWTTNAAFILASGSWMSAGASWLTNSGLQYMGVSESKARVGGNAAAFLVNAGRNLSPTIAVATAANYAAGRFGLWAEKKLMQKVYAQNSHVQALH